MQLNFVEKYISLGVSLVAAVV